MYFIHVSFFPLSWIKGILLFCMMSFIWTLLVIVLVDSACMLEMKQTWIYKKNWSNENMKFTVKNLRAYNYLHVHLQLNSTIILYEMFFTYWFSCCKFFLFKWLSLHAPGTLLVKKKTEYIVCNFACSNIHDKYVVM